jgi:hypothetical protein
VDKDEAKDVAARRLQELRAVSRAELTRRLDGRQEVDAVVAPSGARYQVEVQGMWDDRERQNFRVMVAVDDGGLRAFAPVCDDFIIAPDGSIVE